MSLNNFPTPPPAPLPCFRTLLLLLPMGMLLTALVWNYLPERGKSWLPEGWHAILLIPVLLLIGWGWLGLSLLLTLMTLRHG